MDHKWLERLVNYNKRGIVPADELALEMLNRLAAERIVGPESLPPVDTLPPEVQAAWRGLLRRVRDADFQWQTVYIGTGGTPIDPARLRALCDLWLPGDDSGTPC